jgi:proteasome lid subunit RPN8/RPN11
VIVPFTGNAVIDTMAGMAAASNFEIWSVPGQPVRVEYSAAVLDEIRRAAVDGYHRVPHGGVETGGILFGTRQKNGVRISAWRPLTCEYTKGPSFVLSEAEELALPGKIQEWGSSAELAGLEPVGWYRAHNRSEILLSEVDLNFFHRFFPEAWQIGLIVRPAAFAPTRAGFFFRESGGDIRTQSSYREFVLAPVQSNVPLDVPADEPAAVAAPKAIGAAVSAPVPRVGNGESQTSARPEPSALEEYRINPPAVSGSLVSRPAGSRRRWPLAVAILAVAAAVLGLWLFTSRPARGLALSATDAGGQLRITWDRSAPAIVRASGGTLEIVDGGAHTEVKLSAADLHSGSISYARETGDVQLRMMVYVPGNPPASEITHFLKPGSAVAALPAPPSQPAAKQASVETVKPTPPVTEKPLDPKPREPEPSAPTSLQIPPKRTVTAFRAPAEHAAVQAMPSATIAPPPIEDQAVNPQGAGVPGILNPAAPAAPRPVPPRTTPTSGKIIWTGQLPKDGRLVIQGNHVSSGVLNAALPSRGLFVNAYPGELTSNGMTLFSVEPKYAQPVTEAAGADNGWNRTTYTLDAKRAAAIKVVELPGTRNGYRLVLQGSSQKLSIVVLEWRAQ